MMKAAAPITGGTSGPPTLAAASMPAAKTGRKPSRFISGIDIEPVTTTLATDEPLIVPNNADEITATLAGPPVKRPPVSAPKLPKSRLMPLACISEPKIRKEATMVALITVSEP